MKLETLFRGNSQIDVLIEANLKKFSTLKLKASGDLIVVKSLIALKTVVKKLNDNHINYILLGQGANQILPESLVNGVYIQIKFPFKREYFDRVRNIYVVPASLSLSRLTSHAAKNGLKNWEVFTGIPASVGGAIFMNAGTNLGEIGSLVTEVLIVRPDGSTYWKKTVSGDFKYRGNTFIQKGEVVAFAKMKNMGIDSNIGQIIKNYLAKRNETQPMSSATCGCIFKNSDFKGETCPAGKFIDIIGMKGFTIGDLKVSHKHGNFVENSGDSTSDDILELISFVKDELKLQYGLNFEFEVKCP